jgi:tight adherence protein B
MILLLIAACIVVVMVLVIAAMLYLPARRRAETVALRLQAATQPYTQGVARDQIRRRSGTEVAHAMQLRIERLIGYRRGREPHYTWSLRRVMLIAILPALICGLLLCRVFGPLGYALIPACWVLLLRFYYAKLEAKLGAQLYVQFPDALAMIMRAVRVGVPVTEAVRLVATECQAPTTIEFRQLSDEVAIGVPLDQALRQMGVRNRLPEYRFFATALALQSQTGGGLTETLETLADTIRKRVAARARGHALASEAKTSCYVLAVLPVLVTAGLFATNPGYISVLFTTSGGNKLLAAACTSLGIGLGSMRLIIRKSLS